MSAAQTITRLAVLAISAALTAVVVADDFVWDGACGTENWFSTCPGTVCNTDPLQYWIFNNWGRVDCGFAPPSPGATDNVVIAGASTYVAGAAIGSLVNDGGTLSVGSNDALRIVSGPSGTAIVNSGVLDLTAGLSKLFIDGGDVVLSGSGTVTMLNGYIQCPYCSGRLINENNTIEGTGSVGYSQIDVVNRGCINANVAGGMLDFASYPSPGINSGTMQATSGGILRVINVTNREGSTPGVIRADGGTVRVFGSLTGGNVEVIGTSLIDIYSAIQSAAVSNSASGTIRMFSGLLDIALYNPAGGQVLLPDGADVTLTGSGPYTNDGDWLLGAGYTRLRAEGVVTLSGAGRLVMQAPNELRTTDAGGTLINEGHRIEGSGTIGYGVAVVNRGVVAANDGGSLLLGFSTSTTNSNSGTLLSETGSELRLFGSFVNEEERGPGLIINAGGTLRLSPASVTGGNLTSAPGFAITGSGTLTDVTLTDGSTYTSANSANVTVIAGSDFVSDGMIAAGPGHICVDATVNGGGAWRADGGTLEFRAGAMVQTTGPLEAITSGLLQVTDGAVSGSNLLIDDTGRVNVSGSVYLHGDVDFRCTQESRWSWATGSVLTMNEGTNAAACTDLLWATLEIGSRDDGPGGSGTNNFGLRTLVIGEPAAVTLVDYRDNGNRGGSGGADEALYVENLTLSTGAKLNLNGLHLYANGQPVLVGSLGDGDVVDFHFALLGDVDGDGISSAEDFFAFTECMAGPDITVPPPGVDPEWFVNADTACDEDVDLADFGMMQAQFGS